MFPEALVIGRTISKKHGEMAGPASPSSARFWATRKRPQRRDIHMLR